MFWSTTGAIQALLLTSFASSPALAATLSDFAPRASNLDPACEAIYTEQISACQPSDFQSGKCSSACISALDALQAPIVKACKGLTGNNILVAFANGSGISDICPNADSGISSSTSASGSKTSATSVPASSTTWSAESTSAPSTSAEPTSSSASKTSSSSPSSSGSSTSAILTSSSASTSTSDDSTSTAVSTGTVVSPASSLDDASASSTSTSKSDSPKSTEISAQATSGGDGTPFGGAYSDLSSAAPASMSLPSASLAPYIGLFAALGLTLVVS